MITPPNSAQNKPNRIEFDVAFRKQVKIKLIEEHEHRIGTGYPNYVLKNEIFYGKVTRRNGNI
jgi:hypothetical protein